MNITVQSLDDMVVAELEGEIDAKTAPTVTEKLLPLMEPGSKILMNLTQVSYMSSAGLRSLLSLYRQSTAKDSKLVLVGLSEELQDTMSMTGFLDFFVTAETVDAGVNTLK
jgi:anti-sigma B factor antagonist